MYKTQIHYLVNNILRNIMPEEKYLLEASVRHMIFWGLMSVFSSNIILDIKF